MKRTPSIIQMVIEWGVFLLLAVFVISRINIAFLPKNTYQNSSWPTTNTYYEFYKMEKNSIDVLFLGSSVVVNAFCPQQIYNDYGIRSFNLGCEQQSIFLSYYWLKEALRFQKPKAVVLDLLFLPTRHEDDPLNTIEGLTRKCIDPMRWSSVKVEAVKNIAEKSSEFAKKIEGDNTYTVQSELSYYLTNIRYHKRWDTALNDIDFDKNLYENAALKGWSTMLYYANPDSFEYNPYVRGGGEERAEINELQREYLCKIGELCRENDINLILVNLPGNSVPDEDMTDGFDNICSDIAKEIGADYYNYCEQSIYEDIGLNDRKEWAQYHSNYWGSIKLSQYTGSLLSQKYKIPAVVDEQYEITKGFYAMVDKAANLQYIEDFSDYLDSINDPNYTLFFSIKDEGTNSLTDIDMNKLHGLGIQSNLIDKYRYSWLAVVFPKEGVLEELSEDEEIILDGTIKSMIGTKMTSYSVISAGWTTGAPKSSIKINGIECSNAERGINIVVWDNIGRTVIDSVTFDTYDQAQASRSWFKDMKTRGDNIYATRW